MELLKAGTLGYSSGALAHLVERVTGNGATVIKSWPIGEFSLTPTPAEPRTLGVAEIRSLVELADELRVLLPEDAGNASAEGEGSAQVDVPEAEREPIIMIVKGCSERRHQERRCGRTGCEGCGQPEGAGSGTPGL